jgi:hypothetical protein
MKNHYFIYDLIGWECDFDHDLTILNVIFGHFRVNLKKIKILSRIVHANS